jgi:hypothetical protein
MRGKLTYVLILCLAIAVAASLASVALAQSPPSFEVHHGLWGTSVYFKYWTVGETLTLTIDNLSTATSPDYETSVVAAEIPEDGDGFGLAIDYDVAPGDVVGVTDGSTTKSHMVTDIAVTSVEMAADVVRGTAAPGTEVLVYGDIAGEFSSFAAGDGTWTVDTSAELDIVPGTTGGAEQVDADGDSTVYDWEASTTLAELVDDMVADGRLPNAGVANSILKQAQRAPLEALTNHLASLVANAVIMQQTMDEILVMIAG